MSETAALELAMRVAGPAVAVLAIAALLAALMASRRWRVEEEARSPITEGAETDGVWQRASAALARQLEGTGSTLSATELATIWAACAALPPLCALSFGASPAAAALALMAGAAAPALWLRRARRRARERFSEDLGHALPLVATNLRGGLSIRQALAPVAENLDEPIKGEFAALARNLERGMSVEEALDVMAERNHNRDLVLLSSAVATQAETGGNLADIVDTVAATIRARTELRREILSKSAQQRGSAVFLALFPIAILVAVCALSPQYLDFYTSPAGFLVLAACAALDVFGYAVTMGMTNVRID